MLDIQLLPYNPQCNESISFLKEQCTYIQTPACQLSGSYQSVIRRGAVLPYLNFVEQNAVTVVVACLKFLAILGSAPNQSVVIHSVLKQSSGQINRLLLDQKSFYKTFIKLQQQKISQETLLQNVLCEYVSSLTRLYFKYQKLYIPCTLNNNYLLRHTQLIVCAVKY